MKILTGLKKKVFYDHRKAVKFSNRVNGTVERLPDTLCGGVYYVVWYEDKKEEN